MATLGAGTKLQMSDMEETPTFTNIPGAKSSGTIGEETPTVEVTPMEALSKRYIAGIQDGDEKEITCIYEKDDQEQKKFRDAAKARETRNFKVVYSNGATADINLVLLGFKMNEPEM